VGAGERPGLDSLGVGRGGGWKRGQATREAPDGNQTAASVRLGGRGGMEVRMGNVETTYRTPGVRYNRVKAYAQKYTIGQKNKLRGLSPRANYTDRATAACRRS
jgi:hypothetical protein